MKKIYACLMEDGTIWTNNSSLEFCGYQNGYPFGARLVIKTTKEMELKFKQISEDSLSMSNRIDYINAGRPDDQGDSEERKNE